jgi:hypothetical protein
MSVDTKICEEFTKLVLEPAIIIPWLQTNFNESDDIVLALKTYQLIDTSYTIHHLHATLYFKFRGIPIRSLLIPLKLCPQVVPKRARFQRNSRLPPCEMVKHFYLLPTNREDILNWINLYFAKTSITHDIILWLNHYKLISKSCYLDKDFIVFKFVFRHRHSITKKRFGFPFELIQ